MINYTERLSLLMQDVVSRVPQLSFIDMADVLVFARSGRSNAEGAFATCHCLTLPASEPGYYFWRDRTTMKLTRRSEWFVTKSPTVTIGPRQVKYMLSFTLPRFCDQSLDRSRKERLYPGAEPWIAKLDTVVHELYHIDPDLAGIRRIEKEDGTYSANCHGHRFFDQVAEAHQLHEIMRRLAGEGVAIVYISHRMEEIFELSQTVTVLRDGVLAGSSPVGETSRRELVESIDDYRTGLVPLVVPLTLIRHHARVHDVKYLESQTYLRPHPLEVLTRKTSNV